MRDPRTVLIRPLITEKGTRMKETGQTYLFEVAKDANKLEIKHAVEKLFSVKVVSVRTMTHHGKVKRLGRFAGPRPDWKKAAVCLAKDNTIELFEQL
jgi:large subunit ribosomal protein L23